MIYVIDHKDSFTHNVVHQLSLFDKVKCTNYDKINNKYLKRASTIVLSPGPGSPKDYPITSKIYKNYCKLMISYIGGKSRMAKWIGEYVPNDIETYVEVFGGAFWVYINGEIHKKPNFRTSIIIF